MSNQKNRRNALIGAAFLMATSAIGPGFLTQTATFTQALAASFGFVILLSILLDIGAQLNIWRIVAVSEKQAQDIANQVLPGAGYFLAVLIVMGGLAFNIGNVGGAGLGLNLLTGLYLPEWIWYRGIKTKLDTHSQSHIRITSSEILLPRKETAAQIDHLRRLLNERAREYLLPRLEKHAAETGLTPTATDLSNAKTFWGVCRPHTGIRLNWRLIGAPKYVADYVCIHELCHLRHPDHSPRFWHLVNTLTPHTDNAKSWLKAHGRELFVLG